MRQIRAEEDAKAEEKNKKLKEKYYKEKENIAQVIFTIFLGI
jgi:hypothetical protein